MALGSGSASFFLPVLVPLLTAVVRTRSSELKSRLLLFAGLRLTGAVLAAVRRRSTAELFATQVVLELTRSPEWHCREEKAHWTSQCMIMAYTSQLAPRSTQSMAGSDWSAEELDAIVSDYFEMLSRELSGVSYNKAAHRRDLVPQLRDRSEGSIEFKHANISAALLDLGCPSIEGYKPRANYQAALLETIKTRLANDSMIRRLATEDAERTVIEPEIDDLLAMRVDKPPSSGPGLNEVRDYEMQRPRRQVDYLEREARNRSLGASGESLVLKFEAARLCQSRREDLAERIEHVSVTRGDHEGFDILSFNEDGSDRLIEVKTTKYGKETPFFVSRNELNRSERDPASYFVYRLFSMRSVPGMYLLPGAISDTCVLMPESFSARPN